VILLGHDEQVAAWVASRVSYARNGFGPCVTIGSISEHGHLLGATVFHEYRSNYSTIQMSFAGGNGWLSRAYLRRIWAYPFEQLNCQRVYGCVAKKNLVAQETALRMGAINEATLKQGFGDDDMIIFRVLKEECRWL
jgi:RimJ/RimL family protein N-acetyltransferase